MKLTIQVTIPHEEIDRILLKAKELGLIIHLTPEHQPPIPVIPVDPTDPEIPTAPTEEIPDTPDPNPEFLDITESFYADLSNPEVSAIVLNTRSHRVTRVKSTKVGRRLTIKSANPSHPIRPLLLIGPENYLTWKGGHDGHLIDIQNGAQILIDGVDICLPPQLMTVQRYAPSLFRAPQDPNAKWTVVVRHCDTTRIGRNGGWGLGFLYGGIHSNFAALINFKHAGPGLMDAKNPYDNAVMGIVLDKVKTDFLNEHEFGTSAQLCRGIIEGDTFRITSPEVTTDLFRPAAHFAGNGNNSNSTFIIHIGRFTWIWSGADAILDSKRVRLRKPVIGQQSFRVINGLAYFPQTAEPHAGQHFTVNGQPNQLITKDRTESYEWVNWIKGGHQDRVGQLVCKLRHPLPDGQYTGEFAQTDLPAGEQEVYLISKQNFAFPTDLSTPFGWWQILQTDMLGHLSYNHDNISLWARDVEHSGYYRQTDNGKGRSLFMNLVNCSGFKPEFKPRIPITSDPSLPMPDRILSLLSDS